MCSKACKYSSSERRSFPRLWLILLFITVFSLVVLSPLTGAEKESPGASVLAVAPFENLSGKSEQGYIAFQIYEFMTTLFSELEEWKVVERKDLKKVFDEQKLQLSGITGEDGAVELGNILNAGKILSGSYLVEGERITLYGRIIDTETGEVVQSSQASDSFTNGAGTAMEKLFYSLTGRYAGGRKGDAEVSGDRAGLAEGTEPLANLLLSALEENRWSADVEARLELIRSRGEEQSRELARALEADFSRNDEESLSRLEAIVQNARDNPIGFADTADRYWEQYTRLRGKGIYAEM